MKSIMRFLASVLLFAGHTALSAPAHNVIFVTMDGVRTQEMFQGMDVRLWKAQKKMDDVSDTGLYRRFQAESAKERREKLMPFFWGELMKEQGAIVGNRFEGSVMKLTNRHRFSYPGYSEILTGEPHDDVINSNSKIQNPFPTVLEYLRHELELPGEKVAAIGSWDVIGVIAEKERGTIYTNAGYESFEHDDPFVRLLNRQQFETQTPWDSVRHDSYTFRFAMAYLETHRPRVLYISLGETDDWGHEGRYDRVLQALHRSDQYLSELWNWIQSHDDYRDRTTVFIGTDHGRGDTAGDWSDHGEKIEGAQYVWFAAAGDGVTKRGELGTDNVLGQNQIAATLCLAFGLDYRADRPAAGTAMKTFFED